VYNLVFNSFGPLFFRSFWSGFISQSLRASEKFRLPLVEGPAAQCTARVVIYLGRSLAVSNENTK